MPGLLPQSHISIDSARLNQAGYSLPYHTTSTQALETTLQAMETLAGGVGYGAPRHHHRPPALKKAKKQKTSSRFTLCGCGGNVDLYDDGPKTSSPPPVGPGEKIIGRIRASSFIQPMPSVEYSPALPVEGHPRKRTKTSELDVQSEISMTRPSPERRMASRSVNTLSPSQSSQTTSHGSTESASPKAQVMTAVRSIPSEAMPAHTVTIRRDMASSSPLPCAQTDPPQDGLHSYPRTGSASAQMYESADQREPAPGHRMKRRGGLIGASTSSIPLIDIEEASFDASDDTADEKAIPARSSIASTMSKYSVMSPCIDVNAAPNRSTMGREIRGDRNHAEPTTAASMTDRNSMASTDRTPSVGTISSLHESPAIGDVLSHFPSLPGVDDGDEDDEDSGRPKRINTFGLDRRRDYDHNDEYGLDRINSFHYDDGHLALDLCRRPSSSCDSTPSSTPSSADSIQTESSGLSSRSQKRAAVMCRLPSHHDLYALSRCTDVGDLTWEEKLLKLTKGASSSSEPEDIYSSEEPEADAEETIEFTGDRTISQRCSKETVRSTVTIHKPGRGSSTGQGPFSPPPDLPLPPVPSRRKTGPQLRSQNSMMSIAAHQHSSLQHNFFKANLPRSTTCPDLGDTGYAY